MKAAYDRPLRPPGAADEEEFVELCVACGCCIQSCPEGALVAVEAGGEAAAADIEGTPQVLPRAKACTLCMVGPSQCPTGALTSVAKLAVDMGTAVVDAATCTALVEPGSGCRACVDACPFPGKAIALDGEGRPVVTAARCAGCGLCVAACPTEPESIRVVPRGAVRV